MTAFHSTRQAATCRIRLFATGPHASRSRPWVRSGNGGRAACRGAFLGAVTIGMLGAGHVFWAVAVLMFVWGAFNSSIPVSRSAWLAEGISDAPETGGRLDRRSHSAGDHAWRGVRWSASRPSLDCGHFYRRRGASHFRITRRRQWRAFEGKQLRPDSCECSSPFWRCASPTWLWPRRRQ
jgi:hypothetical protein